MELNKTQKWFYLLISMSITFLLMLGSWWLYLIFKLSNILTLSENKDVPLNFVSMIKWEGSFFVLFSLLLLLSLLYVFIRDQRKTKILHRFYSTITHELRTPLASLKLQTQVLRSKINTRGPIEEEKLNSYIDRLAQDTEQLEYELENHLQIAKIQRDHRQVLTPVNLSPLIEKYAKYHSLKCNIKSKSSISVLGDEFAITTIFKNLFNNTIKHRKTNKAIDITIEEKELYINLIYNDNGDKFSGDTKELGHLFYKYNSPSGSGIGLFIIKGLMKQMAGKASFEASPNLITKLQFKAEVAHEL